MENTLKETIKYYIEGCKPFYNILPADSEEAPLLYRLDYYQHSEGYMLLKSVNLWEANSEEFIFLYSIPKLTLDQLGSIKDTAYAEGKEKANINSEHMCTMITVVFFCEECTEEAKKYLSKCNIHKTFLFSLHGWLDVSLVVYEAVTEIITTNKKGKQAGEFLKDIINKRKG